MSKILDYVWRKRTDNLKKIPLFVMTFDYWKYVKDGKDKSCMFHTVHPLLIDYNFVKKRLQEVVDYIRDKYNMELFTRIILDERDKQ